MIIPKISLKIGLYFTTRTASYLLSKGERKESFAVIVPAVITIIVSMFVVCDHNVSGASLQNINY